MLSDELEEIRKLFERAETETDPERKFSFLEEALDLVDDFRVDHPTDSSELTVANNLLRSNLHRLLTQLTNMRNIDIGAWFNYIKLFLLRVKPEVTSILSDDPALRESHRKFMGLWRDDLIAAMEKYR